jgi:uncharacterized protein YhaN
MLPAAEDRSRTRREVDEAILRLDLRIAEAGGGVPTERLAAECAGEDLQLVRARIDSLDRRLEELGEAWKGAHEDVVRTELGLQGMKDRTLGASLAVDAESTLASIRDLAERWAELKLGAAILARRVARYREKTEVPLLDRASVHFGALTDGAFSGLRAEGKTLVAIRVKGKELAVKALSDGTRDALYVALRVASLERIAATGKALPLVLDDVLVHLDDTRARASLRVLATLARSMQVLFFTHHARLVELAREVVAEEALVVRELGAARAG